MTHSEIEQQETIERYVRDQLATAERRAFQEHFFICDRCFEQVQMTERFVAGVRYAAATGWMEGERTARSRTGGVTFGSGWWWPPIAAMAAASLALAVVVGWLTLYRMPQLRAELAQERQAHAQSERENRRHLDQTLEELQGARQQRAELENQLAPLKPDNQPAPAAGSEPNIPLVMLEATRDDAAAANEIVVPARARRLVLWTELAPDSSFSSFRLQVLTTENRVEQTVGGLKKNAYGAVAVSLPASSFPAGKYLVKLYGLDRRQATLVEEYKLRIRRK